MESCFRHELKYIIDMHDFAHLKSRLVRVLQKDPFADSQNRYHVRSLYFDDKDDTFLSDKINGVEQRVKYRIRIYNKSQRTIKFEKKAKVNNYIRKQSTLITSGQCLDILKNNTAFLFAADGELTCELYLAFKTRLLRPVVIVDYMREAYVYPPCNARITFDMDLAYRAGSNDLFNGRLPCVGVLSRPALIMEIKYGAFFPDVITALLKGVHKTKQAVSKYALCRESA
jgi:hypothetical protein